MAPLTGAVLAAALLLAASGAVKLVRPAAMTAALRGLGVIRGARVATWAIGAIELAVSGFVLTTGSAPACLACALAYGAFTVFVVVALRAPDRIRSCGCTGSVDSPPTVEHAVLTGLLSLASAAAAVTGGVIPIESLVAGPSVTDLLAGVTVLGYGVVVAALGWAVMALLPRVRAPARVADSTDRVPRHR